MNTTIDTEQEAATIMLFACVMHHQRALSQAQIEQLSRMLVLSSKFSGHDLNALTVKALTIQSQTDSAALMQQAASFISEDFRETLFAMICELVTNEGSIDDTKSETLGSAALHLGMSVERMKMMLTTYLIRNKWNVQIVEAE